MMDFDSTAGPSRRVRYGDPDFEETLLKLADEVDKDDSDIDSDAEFIYSDHESGSEQDMDADCERLSTEDDETSIGASTGNYFYGKNRFK
ncbi:unnamed protein product [Acanthoscelides obtectus]|uniref:Uncharacterized protein n=1 Tax=Acanthoscelides obtectus TaxID=200917 RepID=A0A9P0LV49_ACAOB|nr:unnamed protein product [Acanthoscelides obtectus]CAK1652617.1 hypothetical protein AOBTE_LOCUS17868 [Acanthoscelides obtectus]